MIGNPTKDFHTFLGWHRRADYSDEPSSLIAEGMTGTLHLYARFEVHSFRLTYNLTYPQLQTINDVFVADDANEDCFATVDQGNALSWEIVSSNVINPLSVAPYRYFPDDDIAYYTAKEGSNYYINDSGVAFAWGDNSHGQLGDGTTIDHVADFTHDPAMIQFDDLAEGETVTTIFAGGKTAFAITTSKRLFGWGYNQVGQVGDGTNIDKLTPTLIPIPGLASQEYVTKISSGPLHTLALTNHGRAFSWGFSIFGALGQPSLTDQSLTPALIDNSALSSGEIYTDVTAGNHISFLITSEGRLLAMGDNQYDQFGIQGDYGSMYKLPREIVIIYNGGLYDWEDIIAVEVGNKHVIAMTSLDRVFSWGDTNEYGQLGNANERNNNYNPVEVYFDDLPYDELIRSVRVYDDSSFAITERGRVLAWGFNGDNQLGFGDRVNRMYPTLWPNQYALDTIIFGEQDYDYGATLDIIMPEIPAGMEFSGWYTDMTMTIPFTDTTMPGSDVQLWGKLAFIN